jgi:IMP dehydrogenase
VDGDAFLFLAEAGADFVKVGAGGGAICITRDQKGIGRGQASAVLDVAEARDAYRERTGDYVPVCSDGGLMHDCHIALALAMGADFVMMGRYFARFEEAPGAKVTIADGIVKEHRGEGSSRARNWQGYGHGGCDLAFEEGVDGFVPYAGELSDGLALTLAKLTATMVSCGAVTLAELRSSARLTLVSAQSFEEGRAQVIIRDTLTAGASRGRAASAAVGMVALQSRQRPGSPVQDQELALAQRPEVLRPAGRPELGARGLE